MDKEWLQAIIKGQLHKAANIIAEELGITYEQAKIIVSHELKNIKY